MGLPELAWGTERTLRSDVAQLDDEDPAVGKALLVRSAGSPFAPRGLTLRVCDSDERWSRYEDHRIPVEACFGLDEAAARALVRHTRARAAALGLRLWLATGQADEVIGGIAAFRHPEPGSPTARLQEVDVFPSHRGQGQGTALLEGLRRLLVAEGVDTLVVGADEDDWPLTWYRRLGFRQVLRVTRPPSPDRAVPPRPG